MGEDAGAARAGAQVSGEAAPSAAVHGTGLRKKVSGLLGLIPVVGPALRYVLESFGFTAVVYFLLGLIFAAGIVFFGKAPGFLVSSYATKTEKPGAGPKPAHVTLIRADTPAALQPFIDKLENEAHRRGQDLHFLAATVEAQRPIGGVEGAPVGDFEWQLQCSPEYAVVGYGFRCLGVDEGGIAFQPLDVRQQDDRTIQLGVPALRPGDRLMAVLKVSWSTAAKPSSLPSVVASTP